MERKTILAIFLMMAVFLGYDVLIGAPHRAKLAKDTKTIANKEVTTKQTNNSNLSTEVQSTDNSITKANVEAKVLTTKTTNFSLKAMNLDGSIGALYVNTAKMPMPIYDVISIANQNDIPYEIVQSDSKQTVFSQKTSSLEIIKTFSYYPDSIKVRVEIVNKGGAMLAPPQFRAFMIDSSRLETTDRREIMLDEYATHVGGKISRKNNAAQFSQKENNTLSGKVKWVSFRDHFHAFIVKPDFETKGVEIKQVTDKKLSIFIQPDQNVNVYNFIIYLGFQDKNAISKVDKDFSDVVAFSSFLPLELISQAIYYVSLWVGNTIKSWGITIIIMGLLVYGLTYPLTIKSMLSMRKMQLVAPKVNALRERFKNDPQRLNMEMVEIYRREGINPLSGCLPMLLQMPFFMAIYQVLWRAYYFKGKSFLWISDLSISDRLFKLPFSLPFLGEYFNILPILMGGVMFWQQKLTAKNAVVLDETQAAQQKIMTIIFPIFITFIFYNFSASLSLYFTFFYLCSALTQWKMSKVS